MAGPGPISGGGPIFALVSTPITLLTVRMVDMIIACSSGSGRGVVDTMPSVALRPATTQGRVMTLPARTDCPYANV